MIYLNGDPHGDYSRLWEFSRGEIGKKMTKQDFVILLGDVNVCPQTLEQIRGLGQLPFTVLFLDGNHENFPLLESMPQAVLYGGRVHDLGGVYHLQRGEIFALPTGQGSVTVAVCGGGDSRDRDRRTEGVDWFAEEEIGECDVQRLRENAQRFDHRVDYFLSHVMSSALKMERATAYAYKSSLATDVFKMGPSEYRIRDIVGFLQAKAYFCGHEHIDATFDFMGKRFCAVYRTFVRLDGFGEQS